MKVLVIGDIIIDKYVYGTSSRISPEAPVPVITYIEEKETLGGAGLVYENLKSLDVDVELVAKSDVLAIYLSDHGKPISSEGGTAKLTILNGSDKKEYELLPVGGRFELKGAFSVPKGSKAIAVIKLKSKVITARFNL